jgi:ASC-1-like (ASCH) protein
MIHNMKLQHRPFFMIKNGLKTYEIRVNDEKRKLIVVGDQIVFKHVESFEEIYTKVLNLHQFDNFKELYENIDLLKCGYDKKDFIDAKSSDMYQYYSKEKEELYGVLAIEIEVIKKL